MFLVKVCNNRHIVLRTFLFEILWWSLVVFRLISYLNISILSCFQFHEIFFKYVATNFLFFLTAFSTLCKGTTYFSVEKWKNSYWKKLSSNQLFSNFLLKCYFHEICVKKEWVNFRNYHTTHTVEFTKILYHSFLKNFRENTLFSKQFYYKIGFTK